MIILIMLFGCLTPTLWAQSLKEFYTQGMHAYKEGRCQDAFVIWSEGLKNAEAMQHLEWQGAFNHNIGFLCEGLGRYEKALSHYKQAAELSRRIGDRVGEGQTLNNMGLIYKKTYRYETAIDYYNEALEIFREIGERLGESITLRNIGLVQLHLGRYDQALTCFQGALALTQEIGNYRWEAKNLANIGTVYKNLGQYTRALAYQKNALEMTQKIGDRNEEGNALGNIGLLYDYMGRYDEALYYYQQAMEIAREIGDKRDEGTALNNIGIVYDMLNQYDRALTYCEQALFIKKEIGELQGQGQVLNSIGVVYRHLGQHDQELSYYQKSLAISKEIGDRVGETVGLGNIGMVYADLGKYETALSFQQQALTAAKELGDRFGEGEIYFSIGGVYRKSGQYEKAHQSFSESLGLCKEVGAPESLWRALAGLGGIEVRLKRYGSAVSHYERSLDTIESMRSGLTEKEAKTSFMRNKLFVYDEFIELLQMLHGKFPEKGYDRKSFEIFERKQGRVFLEEMGKSGARNFAGLPETVRQKENDLENQLATVQADLVSEKSKLDKDRNAERIGSLEGRRAALKAEKEKLEQEIKTEYPDYHALKYPQPVNLEGLQKEVLKPGEAMLLYGVMREQSCLWAVTKADYGLFTVADGEATLQGKIDAFRKGPDSVIKAIQKGTTQAKLERTISRSQHRINQAAQDLYQTLLPDRARKMIAGVKTLYVIPTGPLYGLPFEALVTQVDSSQTPRYLVEDHAVIYLSSASLLKTIREAQQRRKETPPYPFLAFAHPVYRDSAETDKRKESLQSKGIVTTNSLRNSAYLDLMGGVFLELPETEIEAREIKAILKAPDGSGPLQLRQNASRSRVLALNQNGQLDDYRYVVFSCHGILPGEVNRIAQPALVLSNPDPQTNTEGYLTMADVFGIKLNADMVTLSACNTGRGKAEKGEGVRGLTRAFMYAGTPAISVTLWSVESQSARKLSTGLYGNLQESKNRAEALRQIKLRLIKGEEGELFRHPFFWAPMVIFGDKGGNMP